MKDNLNLMKVGWNDWWWVYEMRWLLVERAHYSWSMNESNGVSETHAEPTWAAVALRSDEWSKQQSELAQQQSKKIENLFEGRPPKQHNHQSTQQSKDICFLLMIDWFVVWPAHTSIPSIFLISFHSHSKKIKDWLHSNLLIFTSEWWKFRK